jgi:hypothetical protein
MQDFGDEEESEADKGRGGAVWDRGDGEFVLPNEPVAQEEEEEEGAGAREEEAVWQGVKAAAVLRERELQGDAQRQSGEHPRHPQRQMMCQQELDRGSMKQEVLERGTAGLIVVERERAGEVAEDLRLAALAYEEVCVCMCVCVWVCV